MHLMHFFTYCVLYTHQLPQSKVSEFTANMLKQQPGLLQKSFISVNKITKTSYLLYMTSKVSHTL